MHVALLEGKSLKVPIHGITSPYSYFEVIWRFAPIQQEAKHDLEQLNRNEKFVDKAHQCFAYSHIKPKFKFAVQLIWATFKHKLQV